MDTNEDCESCNYVLELSIQPLVPYPSSFKYEYTTQALHLQNTTPSIWKEGVEEQELIVKRRRVEKLTSSCLRRLDHDTLLHALSLLDIRSFIRCMPVERSLKRMIQSRELRRMWSDKQSPVVLISSHTLPCKLCLPGSPSSTARVFQPLSAGLPEAQDSSKHPLVVASHRGLVCIRSKHKWSAEDLLDLAVGNPLTGEWVALPRSSSLFLSGGYKYMMEVGKPGQSDDQSVGFKVAAFCTDTDNHCFHVFDSATGEWSSTRLCFPPRTAYKWSVFDLRSSSWRTQLIRRWEIRTGLERSPTEVHRLPHPCRHGFSQWEYKGITYFASAWTVEQPAYEPKEDSAGEFAGYGVWEVMKDGALKTIAAVWGPEVGANLLMIRVNIWVTSCAVNCYASDNLVYFCGESKYSPTMPVVFYDIDTGKWITFDEQHEASDEESPGDHYASAVVYSPSLLVAPTRSVHSQPRKVLPSFQWWDGELVEI